VKTERALDRLSDLAGHGHDVVTFWNEVTELMAPIVPHYMGPCWYTLDPASLLMTSHFNPAMPELPRDWMELEYYEDDVHDIAKVARSEAGISTLHEATGGDPSSSPRWRANVEMGGDQELIVSLRTPAGDAWGCLGLYREPGEPMFSREELDFISAAAPSLGEGARRALLLGEARDPDGPDAPGLVVLSDRGAVESSTPGVEQLVSDLPGGDWDDGRLPSVVLSVAARALRTAEGSDAPGDVAVARVLSDSGRWVVLHGATLVGQGPTRVAVILEPALPARITPLLMAAYGLTEREQDVTRLVLQGESTAGIAERLVVSPHTVQQHLKNVFEKTGVRSRRDLVGKVFFSHYEPRVRDNEGRASDGMPLRGGPVDPAARPERSRGIGRE
jgi:DNA-binding CsgD family transcriptional regulator